MSIKLGDIVHPKGMYVNYPHKVVAIGKDIVYILRKKDNESDAMEVRIDSCMTIEEFNGYKIKEDRLKIVKDIAYHEEQIAWLRKELNELEG